MNLGGRTALVTGASGGLGQAIARGLVQRGASVVLSARQVDVLEALAAETGGRVIPCDLADRAAVERLAQETGPVDVLIANAGVSIAGRVERSSIEEIDRVLDVNLRAPIVLARLLCEGMAERGGGHVVFISSLNGKLGTPRTSLYAATKFGLRGFAQSLREDLRPRGVGVSTIFPGFIRDAGMHHDSGVKLPPYVGTKSPDDVARAVIRAIERDRGEIDVAPLGLRVGTAIGAMAPEVAATVQRKLGATKVTDQYEDAQARRGAG
jgi:short-subunit dehydrogenase